MGKRGRRSVDRQNFRLATRCWLAIFFSALYGQANAVTIMPDNFADTSQWIDNIHGGGPSLIPHDHGFDATIPSGVTPAGVFLAEYDAAFLVAGDFDVQVDYSLSEWGVGGKVGTSVAEWYGEDRVSVGGESYVFGAGGLVFQTTTDMSGKFRLVRDGSSFSGYAWNNDAGTWTMIGSGTVTTADLQLSIGTWSEFALGHSVEVAFDNPIISADSIVPLPADWWEHQTYRSLTPFGISSSSAGGLPTFVADNSSTWFLLVLGATVIRVLVASGRERVARR
jgi:hypothetical protein